MAINSKKFKTNQKVQKQDADSCVTSTCNLPLSTCAASFMCMDYANQFCCTGNNACTGTGNCQ